MEYSLWLPRRASKSVDSLASVCHLLFHLPPPRITPVIFERFSPYHFNAAQYGLKLTPFPIYEMLYPKHLIDYGKIAYYFEGDWANNAIRRSTLNRPSGLPEVDELLAGE